VSSASFAVIMNSFWMVPLEIENVSDGVIEMSANVYRLYVPVEAFVIFSVSIIGFSTSRINMFELYSGVISSDETKLRHRIPVIKNNDKFFI